ncbi:MAG: NUDIX domain-containing protein [Candidatus Marinimicrobia bacterium]|nr:NUDIX domain-containing protein [Candidatus Neomarinimicrobiota bacterium]
MADLTEKQLSTSNVFDGVLLHVYRDEVKLRDESTSIREYIKHPGAAVMIPILENGNIVFERQYRYPLGMELLELPAGKIDDGEEPVDSARRELLEETGYEAKSLKKLGKLHPCIGYSDEVIYIYLAQDLIFHEEQQDKDEFIETFEMTLAGALEGVRTGKITDAKTMISLFWAEKYLSGDWKESR